MDLTDRLQKISYEHQAFVSELEAMPTIETRIDPNASFQHSGNLSNFNSYKSQVFSVQSQQPPKMLLQDYLKAKKETGALPAMTSIKNQFIPTSNSHLYSQANKSVQPTNPLNYPPGPSSQYNLMRQQQFPSSTVYQTSYSPVASQIISPFPAQDIEYSSKYVHSANTVHSSNISEQLMNQKTVSDYRLTNTQYNTPLQSNTPTNYDNKNFSTFSNFSTVSSTLIKQKDNYQYNYLNQPNSQIQHLPVFQQNTISNPYYNYSYGTLQNSYSSIASSIPEGLITMYQNEAWKRSIDPLIQPSQEVTEVKNNLTYQESPSLFAFSNPVSNSSEPNSSLIHQINDKGETLTPHIMTSDEFQNIIREDGLRAVYTENNNISNETNNKSLSNVESSDILENPHKRSSFSVNSLEQIPDSVSLQDPIELNRFISASEALLSWLENCREHDSKNPNQTKLEVIWNKIHTNSSLGPEKCQKSGKKPTQAIARCTPSKNRSQDAISYDVNRVILRYSKEDYINASMVELVNQMGPWCPRYIISQAPLQNSINDYWNMVFEQECEVIAFLAHSNNNQRGLQNSSLLLSGNKSTSFIEGEKSFIPSHWPELNKQGAQLALKNSPLEIRVQAIKGDCIPSGNRNSSKWIERILTIKNCDTKQIRTVIHLQLLAPWPELSGCSTGSNSECDTLLQFIHEVHSFYRQQRNLLRPILITCENGSNKSGLFVAASIGILHVEKLGKIPDLPQLATVVAQQRKAILDQPIHYFLLCKLVAQSAIELLSKRDIIIGPRRVSCKASNISPSNQETSSIETVDNQSSDPLFGVTMKDLMAVLKFDDLIESNKSEKENPTTEAPAIQTNTMKAVSNFSKDLSDLPVKLIDLNLKNSVSNSKISKRDFDPNNIKIDVPSDFFNDLDPFSK